MGLLTFILLFFFFFDVCFMRLRNLDKYRRYYMFPQNRCIFLHGIHVLLFSSLQNVIYVWIYASIILLLQYVFYRYWDENFFNGYLNTPHSFECNIVSRCNVRYGHFNLSQIIWKNKVFINKRGVILRLSEYFCRRIIGI